MASAGNGAIKLTLVVLLFIYPTICSKVFITFKCVDVGGGQLYMVADMSVECFRGEWLFWAALSAVAMVVYVIGIPLVCVLLLWVAHRHGTLQYPRVDADHITPSSISAAVRHTEEYFRNRVAYGSLYVQYEAQFWWCVHGGAPACRRLPSPALTPLTLLPHQPAQVPVI